MHPPTPYPASAKTKSRMRDTAFREITAKANAVSKSEQDFLSVMKKEEEATGKPSKTGIASRRYSVASKFGGPKADNALSGGIAAGEAKPKLNKRTSFLGMANGPQSNGTSTQASLTSGKSTAAPSSKITTNRPAVPSMQEANLGPPKRQPLAPEQAIKLPKPTLDLRKRSVSGYEKAESTQTAHVNKPKGMLLTSARYWLEQVKLAEIMEKHGVSAGFFRLAVECEAEPVELLREELIAYIKRHSLWSNAIQQVLLCYGVTDTAQYTLFSELSANGITDASSPTTPAKILEGMPSNDRDPADQVAEKYPKCSDVSFDNTMPNDTVEESNIKEEALHSQKTPDASEHIESMDADSVTREVVSYIMSSMNHPDSSKNLKNDVLSGPKDSLMLVNSDQDNHGSSALLVAEDLVLRVQECISILNSADPEEAISTGSLPSLNVWNASSKEVDTSKLDVQEEVSITLDNDIDDSVSTEKVAGEEMCVSMELDVDDTTSDNLSDLQSKSPPCQGASSEESNCHASQTADETHINVVKASDVGDEAISADDNYEGLSKSLIDEKSHDKVSGTLQVSEKCESGSQKGRKIKSTTPKAEIEKCTVVQTNPMAESQGNRRSISGRSQNGKEKSAPTSDKKKTEIPASKKDNGAASVAQTSRRLSISTPKPSTSVYVPNIEAGSRTRRKPRISQLTEPGIESNHMHLKSPIVGSEGILATPRQERTVEVGEGSKQVSLNIVEGMDGGTADVMGSMATPGSAGVRRSARLVKPSGGTTMSTPGFVSTRVQRQLGTPMKTEKEVVT